MRLSEIVHLQGTVIQVVNNDECTIKFDVGKTRDAKKQWEDDKLYLKNADFVISKNAKKTYTIKNIGRKLMKVMIDHFQYNVKIC